MDDIKPRALMRLRFAHEIDETVAHVVDFGDEIRMQVDRTAVIVNAVDDVVGPLARAETHEVVHFMTTTLQGRRELGDMGGDAAHRERMETLPRKKRDTHRVPRLS